MGQLHPSTSPHVPRSSHTRWPSGLAVPAAASCPSLQRVFPWKRVAGCSSPREGQPSAANPAVNRARQFPSLSGRHGVVLSSSPPRRNADSGRGRVAPHRSVCHHTASEDETKARVLIQNIWLRGFQQLGQTNLSRSGKLGRSSGSADQALPPFLGKVYHDQPQY